MVFWNEIDFQNIETVPSGRDRVKFRYQGGPLRFQIPRAPCTWGVSQYKSMNLDLMGLDDFIKWWTELETHLCLQEPFKSNLGPGPSLRLKIDEATYVFDKDAKQINPDIREGLFRGQELSVLVDIDSTYFFNGTWGVICRAAQVRFYGDEPVEVTTSAVAPVLKPGVCAFLPISDDS